jgi:hypothetical protein
MLMYGRQPTVQDFRRLVVLQLLRLYSSAPWPAAWPIRIRTGNLRVDGDVVSSLRLFCALRRSTLDHEFSIGSLLVAWLHCRSFGGFVILIITPVIVVRSWRKKDGSQNVVFAVSLPEFRRALSSALNMKRFY